MAVKLTYQMFAKLLSWMALHARSDATRESRSSFCAINWPYCSDAHRRPHIAGATAP
jgi:hypothetical protein